MTEKLGYISFNQLIFKRLFANLNTVFNVFPFCFDYAHKSTFMFAKMFCILLL